MEKQIIISGLTIDDFIEIIRSVVREEFKKVNDEMPEKLLSPAETCKMFQPSISKVTLAAWTAQGKLQDYRIGGRVFYKQSEVLKSLTVLKKYSFGKD